MHGITDQTQVHGGLLPSAVDTSAVTHDLAGALLPFMHSGGGMYTPPMKMAMK